MTDQLLPVLKVAVSIATIGSLLELGLQLEFKEALVGLRNRRFVKGIVLSVGSLALLAHILFYGILTAATLATSVGMPTGQKSILSIGMCSRNSGPAFATALSIPQVDGKTLVMCGLAIFVQATFSILLARRYSKQAGKARAEGATA